MKLMIRTFSNAGLDLPAAPADYALALRLQRPGRLKIGTLGRFDFPAGRYL